MKAQQKEKGFALYLDGHSLSAIATEVGVSASTVERWSVRHGWVSQRMQHNKKRIAEKLTENDLTFGTTADELSDRLTALFEQGAAEFELFLQGKMRQSDLHFSVRQLTAFAVAVSDITFSRRQCAALIKDVRAAEAHRNQPSKNTP